MSPVVFFGTYEHDKGGLRAELSSQPGTVPEFRPGLVPALIPLVPRRRKNASGAVSRWPSLYLWLWRRLFLSLLSPMQTLHWHGRRVFCSIYSYFMPCEPQVFSFIFTVTKQHVSVYLFCWYFSNAMHNYRSTTPNRAQYTLTLNSRWL